MGDTHQGEPSRADIEAHVERLDEAAPPHWRLLTDAERISMLRSTIEGLIANQNRLIVEVEQLRTILNGGAVRSNGGLYVV